MYPDVKAVVHFHAPAVIPFGIVRVQNQYVPNTLQNTFIQVGPEKAPFQPASASCGFLMRDPTPIFDIAEKFGNTTNLLINNIDRGIALASKFRSASNAEGHATMVLMRGDLFNRTFSHAPIQAD